MARKEKCDLSNPAIRKKFVTYKEASELYSIGLTRIQEYAKKAGATYKIAQKVLVNTDILDAYLEQYRLRGEYEEVASKLVINLASYY